MPKIIWIGEKSNFNICNGENNFDQFPTPDLFLNIVMCSKDTLRNSRAIHVGSIKILQTLNS